MLRTLFLSTTKETRAARENLIRRGKGQILHRAFLRPAQHHKDYEDYVEMPITHS